VVFYQLTPVSLIKGLDSTDLLRSKMTNYVEMANQAIIDIQIMRQFVLAVSDKATKVKMMTDEWEYALMNLEEHCQDLIQSITNALKNGDGGKVMKITKATRRLTIGKCKHYKPSDLDMGEQSMVSFTKFSSHVAKSKMIIAEEVVPSSKEVRAKATGVVIQGITNTSYNTYNQRYYADLSSWDGCRYMLYVGDMGCRFLYYSKQYKTWTITNAPKGEDFQNSSGWVKSSVTESGSPAGHRWNFFVRPSGATTGGRWEEARGVSSTLLSSSECKKVLSRRSREKEKSSKLSHVTISGAEKYLGSAVGCYKICPSKADRMASSLLSVTTVSPSHNIDGRAVFDRVWKDKTGKVWHHYLWYNCIYRNWNITCDESGFQKGQSNMRTDQTSSMTPVGLKWQRWNNKSKNWVSYPGVSSA